jgi:phosphonate transport system permease protein
VRRTRRFVLVSIAVVALGAAIVLGLDPRDLLHGRTQLVSRFFAAALAPAWHSQDSGTPLLPLVLGAIRTTVAFAAAGMSLALGLGLVLGFFASSAWWEGDPAGGENALVAAIRRTVAPFATTFVRTFIALLRSIHELLWAMLFLAAVGLSPASAVLAIALPYAGTLAKVWSEMIDEAPRDAANALRAAGASPSQVFLVGLLPRALPDMTAYAFYRFECAVRSSAILGFFGFPTLGYYLSASFENLYYREVWTYLYALFALVLVIEMTSARLRKRGFA